MNRVLLIGRIATEPEFRTTQSGLSNCNFRLAVNRRYKNGNGTYDADFLNCVAWRQNADFIQKYFHKGNMIAMEGTLQSRSYTAQDGSKRSITEVVVENCEFCGPKQTETQPAAAHATAPEQQRMDFTEVPPEDYSDLPF